MNKWNWLLLVMLVGLGLSFYFDIIIVKSFEIIRNVFLDRFFLVITFISSEILIFAFLTCLFFFGTKNKKNFEYINKKLIWKKKIILLWITFLVTALVGFLLKIFIQRERPFQEGIISVNGFLASNSYTIWNFSFPSFQTMLMFSMIPILSKEFPKIKIYWIIFAVLVGISRIYLGVHFLSDVIAGGIMGYLIGCGVLRMGRRNKFSLKP